MYVYDVCVCVLVCVCVYVFRHSAGKDDERGRNRSSEFAGGLRGQRIPVCTSVL